MAGIGGYDGETQMFVRGAIDPHVETLKSLRWAAENDKLEHGVAGPSGGIVARAEGLITDEELKKAREEMRDTVVKGGFSTTFSSQLSEINDMAEKALVGSLITKEKVSARGRLVGRYDSALQMFVDTPREVDMTRLSFLRWLVEGNRLEHKAVGPSSGEYVGMNKRVIEPTLKK